MPDIARQHVELVHRRAGTLKEGGKLPLSYWSSDGWRVGLKGPPFRRQALIEAMAGIDPRESI
jgi:hypothetical protein